jgi:acyl-coenzyme A thioesterase PaaI-like protein
VHVGRTTAIAEGRLTDARGKLLATGTTACAIFR